jgi:hypothetical protein
VDKSDVVNGNSPLAAISSKQHADILEGIECWYMASVLEAGHAVEMQWG